MYLGEYKQKNRLCFTFLRKGTSVSPYIAVGISMAFEALGESITFTMFKILRNFRIIFLKDGLPQARAWAIWSTCPAFLSARGKGNIYDSGRHSGWLSTSLS